MTALPKDAYEAADDVIKALISNGCPDYSSKREEIASLFQNQLWNGNWDSQTDFDDFKNLRFIQEDEFDQHMDEELQELCFAEGHYIFYVDEE